MRQTQGKERHDERACAGRCPTTRQRGSWAWRDTDVSGEVSNLAALDRLFATVRDKAGQLALTLDTVSDAYAVIGNGTGHGKVAIDIGNGARS